MRVAVAGGNGFIGRELTAQLVAAGHDVVWLSHHVGKAAQQPASARPVAEVAFDVADESGPWVAEIARADAVANLSGYPISARWNERVKALIASSRLDTTDAIVRAIASARAAGTGPAVLVNASAVGYYGERGDQVLTEDMPAGTDYMADLCVAWEEAAIRGEASGVRVVRIRTGIVMGDEGVLPRMLLPMRLFFGGPLGNGKQWLSWIHRADIAGIYRHAIETASLSGAVNAGAPNPLRFGDFAAALGRVLHRPSWAPVPRFALRIVLGEATDGFLMSQRMGEDKVIASGYRFRFPEAEPALHDAVDHRG